MSERQKAFSRRQFLKAAGAAGAGLVLTACGPRKAGKGIQPTGTATSDLPAAVNPQRAAVDAPNQEKQSAAEDRTATATPTETPAYVDETIDDNLILSVHPGSETIPDSVIPGGIRVSETHLAPEEAIMVSFVFNGDNSGNRDFDNRRLNAARTHLVQDGLPQDFRIDIPNLEMFRGIFEDEENYKYTDIRGVHFENLGGPTFYGRNGQYQYLMFKATADVRSWEQVAIFDNASGVASSYISRGTLKPGELADVLIVWKGHENVYRGAVRDLCGNPMGETLAPAPAETATPVNTSTPFSEQLTSTQPGGPTSTSTSEFRPSATPTRPFVPTTEVPRPTDTPFVPTVTDAPTQPIQPTATEIGPTPNVPTPLPTSAPIQETTPTVPPAAPSSTPSF